MSELEGSKQEEVKPPKKLDTGLIVGLSAIFISIATLFVYIYQARIMVKQQHASVWPRIEWVRSNVNGTFVEVVNKGIGPAIIKNSTFKLDGKEYSTVDKMLNELLGQPQNFDAITSFISGRVMSPGESFKPFVVLDSVNAHKLDSVLSNRQFELEICYCSIYDDCWTTTGVMVTEGACK